MRQLSAVADSAHRRKSRLRRELVEGEAQNRCDLGDCAEGGSLRSSRSIRESIGGESQKAAVVFFRNAALLAEVLFEPEQE